MAQRVASIFAEIGLDASKLSSGTAEAGRAVNKFVDDLSKISKKDEEVSDSIGKTADEVTRLGGDFTKLDGQVSQMIKQMEAATPQNLEYAESIAKIQKNYKDGNITSEEAAKQLKAVQSAMAPAKDAASKLGTEFKNLTGMSLNMAGGLTIAYKATQEIIKYLREAEQAAVDSAKADAVVEAVLRSTGYAAGLSAKQLDDYAQSLSKTAGIDDELIKSAEAVMLTFTQIGDEVFPRAMQSAADMAAVLGGDLNGKVTMIGKAMNDFTGYTALKRAGVSFTEEQLKQIDNFKATNDLIGYQKLVMAELEREYGGAAEAINKAGDGSENLKIASENLKETIGGSLVPEVRKWNEGWTRFYDNLTRVTEAGNQQRKAMQELGITFMGSVYYQNGVGITREQAQAAIEAQIALDEEAGSLAKVAAAAQLSEEQLAEMNSTNKTLVGLAQSFTTTGKSYEDRLASLNEELAQGKITSEEFATATRELADEHALATHRIILGYIEQQMTRDGILDDKEMEWLLQKGVEWGIYSETAIAEMKAVQAEWEGWSPESKSATFTVTTNYFENHVTGENQGTTQTTFNKNQMTEQAYANGGDFIVPPGYPNDSYGIRVQSGERVQVTPTNEVGGSGMSESMIERMAGVFAVKMAAALQKTLPGIS